MLDFQEYMKEIAVRRSQAPYSVQLFLKEAVDIQPNDLLGALRRNCGRVEALNPEAGLRAFAFLDYTSRFQEGDIPAQILLTDFEPIDKPVQLLEPSLTQTWDWPEAEQVLSECKLAISVTDLLAGGLPRARRLNLFHGVMRSLLEVVPAMAIHWLPSQRVIHPEMYLQDLSQGGFLISAPVNVRMHRVENSEERIMDTMGMCIFDLPDLQCHFLQLDPGDVGRMLYNYADYLFDRGDIIKDGDTIQSFYQSQDWKCRHEMALVDPPRVVLDIHPGQFSPVR